MFEETVLIVDDTRLMTEILTSLIADQANIISAMEGESAIALAIEQQPDLILLDVVLPGIDGFEVCKRLKADDRTKDIAIIFVTGLHTESADEMSGFELGAVDYVTKPFAPLVVRARVKTQLELARRNKELRERSEELRRLATVDHLTGCFNRRYFMNAADTEISRTRRHDRPLAVAMLDIDHFKQVNDTYGHQAGDLVLIKVAKSCEQALRDEDILGRIGGEEFAVLLPETCEEDALSVLTRMCDNIRALIFVHDGQKIQVTVSVGLTLVLPKDISIDDAIKRADAGLYLAKNAGRDRIVIESAAKAA